MLRQPPCRCRFLRPFAPPVPGDRKRNRRAGAFQKCGGSLDLVRLLPSGKFPRRAADPLLLLRPRTPACRKHAPGIPDKTAQNTSTLLATICLLVRASLIIAR